MRSKVWEEVMESLNYALPFNKDLGGDELAFLFFLDENFSNFDIFYSNQYFAACGILMAYYKYYCWTLMIWYYSIDDALRTYYETYTCTYTFDDLIWFYVNTDISAVIEGFNDPDFEAMEYHTQHCRKCKSFFYFYFRVSDNYSWSTLKELFVVFEHYKEVKYPGEFSDN